MPIHENLATALAAFQAELPKVRKDETAKVTGESKTGGKVSYTYGYAGLDTVVDTVLPVLGKHGLSITSKSTIDAAGNFVLEVTLLHEGGERETGYWPLPDPRRVGPQDLGSAYTYGRRYLTLALTGTFPGGEDEDGQKAQAAARDSWDNAKPAPAAAPAAPKTSWTDEEVYSYQEKMPTAELDKTVKAYDWMAGKGLHNRAVPDLGVPASGNTRTATELMAIRLADEALKPDATSERIAELKSIAEARGLLKVAVSDMETLDQVFFEAHELAAHAAAAEASQDPAVPDAE